MSFSETISPFFGRCALVWFYAVTAANMVTDFHGVSLQMAAKHVPLPPLVLVIALVLVVIGCISLLFGYHARHGAVLLFGLTVVAAVLLHDFWHSAEPGYRAAQFEIFSRDMAICGGLLLMIGMGPGPFAIDNRGKGGGGKGRR